MTAGTLPASPALASRRILDCVEFSSPGAWLGDMNHNLDSIRGVI